MSPFFLCHVMAYGAADCRPRKSMVMDQVATNGTNRSPLETTSGLRARAHRSQRHDQREHQQFRSHFVSSSMFDERPILRLALSNWRDSFLTIL
jgi:hypothetical protein